MATSNRAHSVALVGRAEESHILNEAYKRCKACNSSEISTATAGLQELVLIQGRSGTGKTALVDSIVDKVIREDKSFFLSGKFEVSSNQNPYEVFVTALEKLPEMVILSEPGGGNERSTKIRQAIREAVGSEEKILANVIPALEHFMGQQEESCDVQGIDALQRFQFAFSRLVRAVSSVAPLVLFLDDLHWSDPSSLSLLQVILESPPEPNQSSQLLVICAFRDDVLDTEQSSTPNASTFSDNRRLLLDFLKRMTSSTLVNVTEISLGALDEDSVSILATEYMGISSEISKALGSILYAKSDGNPFHVLQLLRKLMHHKDERKNSDSQQGNCDEVDVKDIAEAADTIDELLRQKLEVLPPLVQQVMRVAACMGDCIDHPALCTVFEGNVSEVENALQLSLNDGFVAFDPRLGQYRFAHDRMRHAVLSTIHDRNVKSFEIGRQLWTRSSPMFLNTKLFVVVNLLNHGTNLIDDQSERYNAAAINLEAGLKALSLAAFQDASSFLLSGIEFLKGGDYWNDQYELSLKLFNAATDAELCLQHFDNVNELVREVFERARSVKDKLGAHVALINSMGQRGDVEAATQAGVKVMKELGEPLPQKVTNLTILVEIVKTRMAIRGRDNATLLTLLPWQDQDKIAAVYVLTNLLLYAYQASSNYVAVIAARIVRLSLKYGMHKCCAIGFAVFGLVMCAVDRTEGYRLGTLSLTMIERYRARELLSRVHMNFYGTIHHWRKPLVESLKPLENSFRVGMETGDVEHALISFSFYLGHALYQGKPLSQVESFLNEAIWSLKLFGQEGILVLVKSFHQFVHNLTGRAPVNKVLSGEASPLYDSSWEANSVLVPYFNYGLGAELGFMFGDLELATRLIDMKNNLGFEPFAFYYYSRICFKEALIYAGLVRNGPKTRRRRNLKNIQHALKLLTAWATGSPQNYEHKQRLVQAELKSLSVSPVARAKQRNLVRSLYDQAIAGAVKEGYLEEAALANELAGDHMNRLNDLHSAQSYWDQAHKLYLEWGATAKAMHLSTERDFEPTLPM